jgi:hypothetical protein
MGQLLRRKREKRGKIKEESKGSSYSVLLFSFLLTRQHLAGCSRFIFFYFPLPLIVSGLRQFLHLVRGVLHGLDDVVIPGATAKISLESVTNFGFAGVWVVLQQVGCAHDHARRAVAALQAVHFPESFLQRVQVSGLTHAFNRGDARAIDLYREHRAGFHGDTIDMNGAGSALAGVATNMRAGQIQGFAQVMDQKRARFNV